ncbi:hypothetical protein EU528_06560 [Candidatus Thorarchaeota archaeon]|nr:MAG: hypothetical protein EU528_06560 [Candidatus Thorarchaeota archaeon]
MLQLKRPKIDYLILITAFLLIASNQVFETTPLRAIGTIEITNGSAIPQDTNYTITTTSVPSVSSAILINESLLIDSIYTSMPVDHIDRIVCNITLQSNSESTPIRIIARFGMYTTYFDVIAGIQPQTFSIEPDMDLVHASDWITACEIITTKSIDMILQNVVVWADFDTLLSPVVLDIRSTDGQNLYDDKSPRSSLYSPLRLTINRHSDDSTGSLFVAFQNRTLYLPPMNYSFTTAWAYSSYPRCHFNITVQPDIESVCLIHVFVIRIDLEINTDFPFLHLEIGPDGDSFPTYSGDFHSSQIPKYVFLHPIYGIEIEVDSLSPLSESNYYNRDIFASGGINPLNGSNNLNVKVSMPYVPVLGLYVTTQDFIQISVAIVLFTVIILRVFLFLNTKKPRTSWKDPRLIPIVLLGLTAFIPWLSTTNTSAGSLGASVNVASFGVFPLIVGWTNSGSIFLALHSSGVIWAIVSLFFFWIPLLYANYAMTPPSILDDNYKASLVLFSPLFFLGWVQYGLEEYYNYHFTHSIILQSLMALVPVVFLSCLILLRWDGKFDYGLHKNQLALDVNLAEQLVEKKSQTELISSKGALEDEEPQNHIKIEARKTVNLVLVILQFLFFLIPTTIGYHLERIISTQYSLTEIWYGNPINSVAVFLGLLMDSPGALVFWILCIPAYFIFTFGIIGEFGMESRRGLTIILIMLWGIVPFILLPSISMTHYYYIGVEWILVSLPYFLLNCIAVMKIGAYIKDETNLQTALIWILLPAVFMIPGGLILNLISTLQMASLAYWAVVWRPLPIATIIMIIVMWPIRYWYKHTQENLDVDIEMDEMLHSNNPANDI